MSSRRSPAAKAIAFVPSFGSAPNVGTIAGPSVVVVARPIRPCVAGERGVGARGAEVVAVAHRDRADAVLARLLDRQPHRHGRRAGGRARRRRRSARSRRRRGRAAGARAAACRAARSWAASRRRASRPRGGRRRARGPAPSRARARPRRSRIEPHLPRERGERDARHRPATGDRDEPVDDARGFPQDSFGHSARDATRRARCGGPPGLAVSAPAEGSWRGPAADAAALAAHAALPGLAPRCALRSPLALRPDRPDGADGTEGPGRVRALRSRRSRPAGRSARRPAA